MEGATVPDSIDIDHVRRWVDSYLAAWTSNDPAAIKDLFTPEASYRVRPYATPKIGVDAIAADWIERKDEPGTWTARLEPLLVHDDIAIVTGEVDYTDGDRYSNLWVIRFGEDARAVEFTEWWMDRREDQAS
jgi:ketosteroid isomerase-like protein